MKTVAPDYYEKFRCIADRCRRSCCIGWEIYVDSETLTKYKQLGAEYTEVLRETEDGTCFRLTDGERCPFLNERGLCDIILEKGEGFISEICREHPRFYNLFSDRTEVGLGMSCEEAARIILSQKGKTELTVIEDDGVPEEELWEDEEYILRKREELFELLQNRRERLSARVKKVLAACDTAFPAKSSSEWYDIYNGLEIMDVRWTEMLKKLNAARDADAAEGFDTEFEKLMIYFLYRHASSAADQDDFTARVLFACLSCYVIGKIFAASADHTFERLHDVAVTYSAEIEYSEENTAILLDILSRYVKNF